MRHAFLITAYKNPGHLRRMMDLFDERFDFYVHIDARSRLSEEDTRLLLEHPRCRFVSRKYVNRWGGVNHLMAMLLLAREALGRLDYDYLHVRSGQDYPIRTADAIDAFFEQNHGTEFVKSFPLPDHRFWGPEGGYERFQRFQLYTYLDVKKPRIGELAEWIHRFQRKIQLRRRIPASFPNAVYGGSQWVSYTGDLWRYILERWDANPSWYRLFRFSFCAEEIVLPTMAHAYKGSANVSDKRVNFVHWVLRNGNNPANLDESDFDRIRDSEYLFVRKVDYPVSVKLMERIDRELLGR